MLRKLFISICASALLATLPAHAAEVLDRIVASVNGTIILQSDWNDALSYEALCDNRPVALMSADERKGALDHLIDRELLQEQMRSSDFQRAGQTEIAQQIETIRKQYPEAQSEQGWQAVLNRYGLSEAELKRQVAM